MERVKTKVGISISSALCLGNDALEKNTVLLPIRLPDCSYFALRQIETELVQERETKLKDARQEQKRK